MFQKAQIYFLDWLIPQFPHYFITLEKKKSRRNPEKNYDLRTKPSTSTLETAFFEVTKKTRGKFKQSRWEKMRFQVISKDSCIYSEN